MDNDEKVNNFDVYLDVLNAFKNTGIRFAYSYSDSDNGFLFGGPRVNPAVPGSLAATKDAFGNPTFEQLPNVTNTWQQFMIDLKYSFNAKIGFAVGYFYEKLDMTDFATINLPGTDRPRIDYLGGLTTGLRQPAVQRQHVHRAPSLHVLGVRYSTACRAGRSSRGGRPGFRTRRGPPGAGRFGCLAAPNLIRWGRVEIESQ